MAINKLGKKFLKNLLKKKKFLKGSVQEANLKLDINELNKELGVKKLNKKIIDKVTKK